LEYATLAFKRSKITLHNNIIEKYQNLCIKTLYLRPQNGCGNKITNLLQNKGNYL